MLMSPENSAFSNFWMDQDSRVSTSHIVIHMSIPYTCPFLTYVYIQGYYRRHEDYLPILTKNFTGCFRAPVLTTAVLIRLSSPKTQGLVYHPPPSSFNGPTDDVVQFAFSAKTEGD